MVTDVPVELTPSLRQQLDQVPDQTGCYLFKDSDGQVLYVGKAENLRSRIRSYFQDSATHSPRIRILVSRVRSLEVMVTHSPVEALLLECNLIKRFKPYFNVQLRDDKHYPYICLTMNEPFPRPIIVRRAQKDGNRYFGPYTSSWAMRQALRVIRQVFQLRGCSRQIEEGDRQKLCLDYHLGLCSGPCASMISRAVYLKAVDEATDLLQGKAGHVLKALQAEMMTAAENLQFERAVRLRDQIAAIRAAVERQRVVSNDLEDQDVLALVSDQFQTCALVMFVRGGRLVGQEHYFLEGAYPEDLPTAMQQFVQQYYERAPQVPGQVLLSHTIPDLALVESWLRERRGGRVRILVPQRGEKRQLLEMAEKNAFVRMEERRSHLASDQAKAEEAMLELQEALALPNLPYRIEGFDVSHFQGAESVAAMVVFEAGQPKKTDYRRFKMRSVEGPNDFASIQEALRRRLQRAIDGDPKFAELPDLLLIDGGKGQLNAALEVTRELAVEIPAIGLAKQFEEVYLPGQSNPVILPRSSQALFLLQRLRDEAHRFGLAYHRQLRGKRATHSALDEIAGIGRKRRDALLRHFGSVEALRCASPEELASVPGMTWPVAERVHHFLHQPAPPPGEVQTLHPPRVTARRPQGNGRGEQRCGC
ncbi:MAG: excinuclease ABC subunit UvrC [Armatimonadetes bacterium]|nr:excinuclease ABC subunit UvrC [Armatimonadota bacterium]